MIPIIAHQWKPYEGLPGRECGSALPLMPPEWPKTREEAERLQEEIAGRVRLVPLEGKIRTVAGIDASFAGEESIAAVCVYDYPSVTLLEKTYGIAGTGFPYVPGYLAFREGPALLSAVRQLRSRPDLLLFDGQGIAHPRRAGIASHLGVLLDIPSIGCAKSWLTGRHDPPPLRRGAWEALYDVKGIVGAALVTRDECRPLYVSPGHRITLEQAVEIVLHLSPRYRVPEPLRCADAFSRQIRDEFFRKKLLP